MQATGSLIAGMGEKYRRDQTHKSVGGSDDHLLVDSEVPSLCINLRSTVLYPPKLACNHHSFSPMSSYFTPAAKSFSDCIHEV